jgi:hypothetical protein
MLDEPPPEEPPARASASAGAKATLVQKNSARIKRHFRSRLAIAPLAQNLRSKFIGLDMGCAGSGGSTAEPNIAVGSVG